MVAAVDYCDCTMDGRQIFGRRRTLLTLAVGLLLPTLVLTGCSVDRSGETQNLSGQVAEPTAADATTAARARASAERRFVKIDRITGKLTPTSVDASVDGTVIAQNTVSTHTMVVYGPEHTPITTIEDQITPNDYGYTPWTKPVRGGPVEAAFSPDGTSVWVTNYSTTGPGFSKPGRNSCSPSSGLDRSFLYRIDTETWEIKDIVLVGVVPKGVEVSPDGKTVLVTNWCSYDLSVIDTRTLMEIGRIPIGRYPRGIAVSPDSKRAYVAVTGAGAIVSVDLAAVRRGGQGSEVTSTLARPGRKPHGLALSPDGRTLYASVNGAGTVAKINARTGQILGTVRTGRTPGATVLSPDGTALFVVNFGSDTITRVRTKDLRVLETTEVDRNPIGVTYNAKTREVWVCSYSGSITVLADRVRSS
jgi:YVTN family beta-propeller protein